MSYALAEKELETLPEELTDEVTDYIKFLKYKFSLMNAHSSVKRTPILGLAEGQYSIPDDINAYDDEVADIFEGYV